MALKIGVTGTIGSGKSTVARLIREAAERRWPPPAATLIDADRLAREAVEPGRPALAEIAAAFGAEILDGEGRLRRDELARRVFADRAALARLEAIVHPRVREAELAMLREAEAAGCRLIVLDIPLLFEAGMAGMADRIVVVAAGEAKRFGRLKAKGIGEAQAIARIGRQMAQARKKRLADATIDNDGDLAEARRQVEALLDRWEREPPAGRRENDEL
jgi:dephospho-CoA kinase